MLKEKRLSENYQPVVWLVNPDKKEMQSKANTWGIASRKASENKNSYNFCNHQFFCVSYH